MKSKIEMNTEFNYLETAGLLYSAELLSDYYKKRYEMNEEK